MKVYIVTAGEYSDYHIEAVFTDVEQAQRYCAAGNSAKYANYEIETYDADVIETESNKAVNLVWHGATTIASDGKVNELNRYIYHWETFDSIDEIIRHKHYLDIYVTTSPDVPEEKVRRIMIDRLSKWKYENMY